MVGCLCKISFSLLLSKQSNLKVDPFMVCNGYFSLSNLLNRDGYKPFCVHWLISEYYTMVKHEKCIWEPSKWLRVGMRNFVVLCTKKDFIVWIRSRTPEVDRLVFDLWSSIVVILVLHKFQLAIYSEFYWMLRLREFCIQNHTYSCSRYMSSYWIDAWVLWNVCGFLIKFFSLYVIAYKASVLRLSLLVWWKGTKRAHIIML